MNVCQPATLGRFIAVDEIEAPALLTRMASADLPVAGERYGIETRLIAKPGVEVVDLAACAFRKLLNATAIDSEDLGAFVLTSRVPNADAVAREVAGRVGFQGKVDGVERACSGFPAAIVRAIDFHRELSRPVAVVAAEIISRNINWEPASGDLSDHRRARGQAARLFADGAAAVIVGTHDQACRLEILDAWQSEIADERQLIQKLDVEQSVDPWGRTRANTTSCISMPGRRGLWLVREAPQVMANAIAESVRNAKEARLLQGDDTVTHVVPHQPNGLILERLEKVLREAGSDARVWNCIKHTGNTVSASIPLAMTKAQDEFVPPTVIAMPSIGAGGPGYRPDVLSTGCVLVKMVGDSSNAGTATT